MDAATVKNAANPWLQRAMSPWIGWRTNQEMAASQETAIRCPRTAVLRAMDQALALCSESHSE